MGKMCELDAAITDLRNAATTINEIANTLAELFSGGASEEPAPAPVEPALTLEQVRAILADKSRAGYTAQIRELLQKHSATKLSSIDPANYKALLADVEGLTDAT